jgi:NADH:ubiquinone oxidoreductase subunit F (NADH-binding)
MVEMLEAWMSGSQAAGGVKLLDELSHALKQTSICGLGQIAPVPIQSVIKNFPDMIREHLEEKRCRAGVCFSRTGAAS